MLTVHSYAALSGRVHHPVFGAVNWEATQLSGDPDGQVAETISLMGAYAAEDSRSELIRREAQRAMLECPECSPEEAVFRFVKRRVRFAEDAVTALPLGGAAGPDVVEVLIRPVDLSAAPARVGDCDDFAMYGASLLMALGRRVSFVTVAADPGTPQEYSHVYLASYDGRGNRVAVDSSHGAWCGWEVPDRFGKSPTGSGNGKSGQWVGT